MKGRKTGSRLISFVLSLVMIVSMAPMTAGAAPAADSDTISANVDKVLSYAEQMRKNNVKEDYTKGGFSWDTEKKEDSWRYFNGLMLDAFLLVGGQDNIDYAKAFYDDNIADNGTITGYAKGELDAVEAARGLFDLLDAADNDKYEQAVQFVYNELENQTAYEACGGNYQHKENSESWKEWNIGLDGLYMAQPFLMECANAIEDGKLILKDEGGSTVTAETIYQEVYNRMAWVTEYMRDEETGLYHHGWNVAENSGNGSFWSRGIGWYAMAQVDIIEMMPEGEYRTAMINQLPAFFDAMLTYQDADTGMWYNVTDRETDLSKNKLETSGSAMMAYALMKAYNNGYVTDAKYGEAGLKAFNGIVDNKVSGDSGSYTVSDIYQKSGVGSNDEYYCEQNYVNNEAKGTGALIMAATLANTTADRMAEEDPEEPTTPPETPDEPEMPQTPQPSDTVTGNLQGETRYVLDTDGVDDGGEYLILNSKSNGTQYALRNNNDRSARQSVGVSGNVVQTIDNEDYCVWTFRQSGDSWRISNGDQYLRLGNDDIISGSAGSLTVTNRESGEYRISGRSGWTTYYLRYSSNWQSSRTASSVYLFKKETTPGASVAFSVTPGSASMKTESTQQLTPTVLVDNNAASAYEITWNSDHPEIASVDNNGNVTAVSDGTANITATLTSADGTAMQEEITITIPVSVTSKSVTSAVLSGNTARYTRQNVEPDFKGIVLTVTYDDESTAEITTENGLVISGYDITQIGTSYGEISYLGVQYGTVRVTVEGDPYDGLTDAIYPDEYPEYPDDGAVRIDKTATGQNFNSTGAVKVELDTAGISVKQGVDVVLVVDVSNSMGWTDDWFIEHPDATTDNYKIPAGSAETTTDKLDQAMASAQEFARILLGDNEENNENNNSLSFVTFAGFDADNTRETGTKAAYIDSVQTVFTNVQDADLANIAFSNTKFTDYAIDGTSVDYTLQIGNTTGRNFDRDVNRGNTNYDYAFGEANAAVNAVKNAYGGAAGYDETGRETIVVFMTDGAPSHYNDNRLNGDNNDTKYGTTTIYEGVGDYNGNQPNNANTWLQFISNPNTYAQTLNSNIDDFYAVGFDLNHGGFSGYSWSEEELRPVLENIAGEDTVQVELAENGAALEAFYRSLATEIKYAGTNAVVKDTVDSNFTLQTTIKTGTGTTQGTLDSAPTIDVIAYDLWTKAETDDRNLIGRRKGTSTVMETVTFSEDGLHAYSDKLSGDIMTTDAAGNILSIEGMYFTYTNTNGVETFEWNIGDITEQEMALSYYAYLKGSMEGECEEDVYYTNEGASLEYVDINGKHAKLDFPMPAVAWGGASTTFEYYLVDYKGDPVNRAGEEVPFANRIVLYGDTIALNLNQDLTVPAQTIEADEFLPEGYYLYDVNASYTVNTASSEELPRGISVSVPSSDALKEDQTGAQTTRIVYPDPDNTPEDEKYIQTRVAFGVRWDKTPIVMDYELVKDQVVVDYGKAIQADVLANDDTIPDGYTGELIGFTAYNPRTNLKQAQQSPGSKTYTTDNGTYSITGGKANFKLEEILSEVEKVFCVVQITQDSDENNYYYLYEELDIIPASNVYYETDFAEGVFTFKTTGAEWKTETVNNDIVSDGPQDDGTVGQNQYGYDNSYANDKYQSDGSSWQVIGASTTTSDATTAEFSFKGTGFDIISRTGEKEGFIRVSVYSDADKTRLEKRVTVLNKSESQLTLYQIPVVSVENLDYGTHYVEIGVTGPKESETYPVLSNGGQFHFDAIRIYNPINASANALLDSDEGIAYAAYVSDGEADAVIQEVRNMLIAANTFDETDPDYVEGVSFIDRTQAGAVLSDYKTIGPNNEVYLTGDQNIGFKVKLVNGVLPASIDIGAKSADGNPVTLHTTILDSNFDPVEGAGTGDDGLEINSSTAQFYDLMGDVSAADAFGEDDYIYVLIDNLGDGVLSITDLKIASGSTSSDVQIVSDREGVEQMTSYLNNMDTQEDADYDVLSAEFTSESIKRNKTAVMNVTTSDAVETLQVQNVAGRIVEAQTTAENNGDGTKTWTVTFKVTSVGNQKFTVTGYGADGTAGASVTACIKVTVR